MYKTLYVFTLKGCPQCDEAKRRLNNEKVPYNELDIDEYQDVWEEVIQKTNQDYVPVLFFDEHGGDGKIYVPNKDYDDIDGLIEIVNQNMMGE